MTTPSLPELPKKRRAFHCLKCGSTECVAGHEEEHHPACAKCHYLGFASDCAYNDDEMRAYALSALAADRAATAPDERAAFEAWARATHDFNPRWSGQSYWGAPGIDSAWLAWQARAALTASDRAANSLAAPEESLDEATVGWYYWCLRRGMDGLAQHLQRLRAPVGVGREAERKELVPIRPQSTPCGECHLQAGEKCDICGARSQS